MVSNKIFIKYMWMLMGVIFIGSSNWGDGFYWVAGVMFFLIGLIPEAYPKGYS